MDWAKPKAAMARLALLDSAAAEVAFFLALSLVPFVGIAIVLAGRWLPAGLSASIGKVLRDSLPAESPVADEVLRWARSSASKGWLTVGFLLALWSSFRFMSLCLHTLGSMISGDVRSPSWTWRSTARSLLLLAVWMVALVATALFLLVAPSVQRGLLGLPALSDLSSSVFSTLRVLLVPGILFGAIWLTYRVAAGTLAGSFRVTLVTLLASLGWIGASLGFSLAVPVLWSAARLYSTLGSLVLFLIWAYFIAWILLLGGLLLARPGWARDASERGGMAFPPALP
jgi:membrane protein